MSFLRATLVSIFIAFAFSSCGSGDSLDDLLDLATDPPERKPIDVSRMGVNNFFVNSSFGSIGTQYSDIRNTLDLRAVRVLLAWTDSVQPSPSSSANFSFFDNILGNVPAGVDVLVVVAHTPSWMTNSANWIDGNPRKTWVERWLRPVLARYGGNGSIVGWEIWNEPDFTVVPSDVALGLEDPNNYFQLLSLSRPVVRSLSPGKRLLNSATRSIQQNFPNNLNYNRSLRDLGATSLVDVWNIHYYGAQYENVVRDSGVREFLNSLGMPIWITESGAQGPNNQLAYVERTWPFLREQIPSIERIYYYEYSSTVATESNYGLRTSDPNFPVSDLYIYLRDRN